MEFVAKAKTSGLSSLSELHKVKGHDNFAYQMEPKPNNASTQDVAKSTKYVSRIKNSKSNEEEGNNFEVQMPQGINLTSVLDIDVPFEEVGNLFQLLEFCSIFGKDLGLREGQPTSIVHELFSSERTKRQQYCSIISMIIQLLELISHDRNMSLSLSEINNNWFNAIGDLVLKSGVLSNEFPPETFKGGDAKYNEMDASRRLKLLNFLCDESLTTLAMRNIIKNKVLEFEAKKKEAKQKATVANKKEKQLRKTMRSDFAKIHKENTGVPLSSEEHNKLLSQLRAQAKEAHEEMMEAKNMISKRMQTCDVVRTDPIIIEDNGLVLWKLKCFEEEPKFLLQDLGTFDDLSPYEKWLAFKAEQKEEIEKFISSKRKQCKQRRM
ncbi:DDT domain [Arabidopsis suecica]|uniref:DDT domain n=1 Tax=Arabidopsis suecica TaxID=45249 RepID=A0A8T1YPM8_ARASU|nr:DDT domain [Arabidopsis suecica]